MIPHDFAGSTPLAKVTQELREVERRIHEHHGAVKILSAQAEKLRRKLQSLSIGHSTFSQSQRR
jgi:hypothetical protein